MPLLKLESAEEIIAFANKTAGRIPLEDLFGPCSDGNHQRVHLKLIAQFPDFIKAKCDIYLSAPCETKPRSQFDSPPHRIIIERRGNRMTASVHRNFEGDAIHAFTSLDGLQGLKGQFRILATADERRREIHEVTESRPDYKYR